jgi:manganese/zinc/iron transport system substrate-binding protein
MIADVVKNIGEPYITVKTLMGPGVDPHLYRPRESDVAALSNAQLIFYNGLHLEGKMGEIFVHMNRYVPTIAVAEVIHVKDRIASEFQDMYDPHVWHDVALWKQIIPSIAAALCDIDPVHANYYQKRAADYSQQLYQLDEWVKEQIQKIPQQHRILVTAHDAFSYFGHAYGMQVVGLQGISTDAQVSMHDIQQAVDYIVCNTIPAVFLESSISPQSINAVQRAVQAVGHSVIIASELFSDSLGDASTTADSYCGMIQCNVKTIVSALTQ